MPPALAPVPPNRNPERADVDCIELIETLQEDLADPMMRRIALKSGAVSRGFVYNLRRRLFYNPRFDRYIALADVLGYDVYAFARVVVSGAAWAAELSKTCRLEHETIAAFAPDGRLVLPIEVTAPLGRQRVLMAFERNTRFLEAEPVDDE